jgi:hypothetical protein
MAMYAWNRTVNKLVDITNSIVYKPTETEKQLTRDFLSKYATKKVRLSISEYCLDNMGGYHRSVPLVITCIPNSKEQAFAIMPSPTQDWFTIDSTNGQATSIDMIDPTRENITPIMANTLDSFSTVFPTHRFFIRANMNDNMYIFGGMDTDNCLAISDIGDPKNEGLQLVNKKLNTGLYSNQWFSVDIIP